MKRSLKEIQTIRLSKKHARSTDDRVYKLENKQDNVIHDGLSLNPRPSDLAVDAGELFRRNEDNDAWERVGAGIVFFEHTTTLPVSVTVPTIAYLSTPDETYIWSFILGAWKLIPKDATYA